MSLVWSFIGRNFRPAQKNITAHCRHHPEVRNVDEMVDDIRRVSLGRREEKNRQKKNDDGRNSEATRKPQRTIMTRREDAESKMHKREDALEEKLAWGNCRGVSSHLIIIINSRIVLVVLVFVFVVVIVIVAVAVEGLRDHPLESTMPIPSVFVSISG